MPEQREVEIRILVAGMVAHLELKQGTWFVHVIPPLDSDARYQVTPLEASAILALFVNGGEEFDKDTLEKLYEIASPSQDKLANGLRLIP